MPEVDKQSLYRRIAAETGLPIDEVEKAVKHQFRFVASTMKKGEFEGVRLPYFGKFWVNPKRLKHLQNYKNEL